MKIRILIVAFILPVLFTLNVSAQSDTLVPDSTVLLPKKYLFTQRIMWGEKGLMRQIPYFTLTQESRNREMSIRNTTITAHQWLGYAALAGMVAQGFVGAALYNGNNNVSDLHEGLSSFTNACYFTSLGLILFSPPPKKDREPGVTKFQLHRYLAPLHIYGMITTNILAGMLEDNTSLRPYHRAAAFTALASYATAIIIIKL